MFGRRDGYSAPLGEHVGVQPGGGGGGGAYFVMDGAS